MKKLIYPILFTLITFCSCKKSATKTCWHCEFGQSLGGETREPVDVCNDGELPSGYVDSQGHPFSIFCDKQ